jgi:hypothetical protein
MTYGLKGLMRIMVMTDAHFGEKHFLSIRFTNLFAVAVSCHFKIRKFFDNPMKDL